MSANYQDAQDTICLQRKTLDSHSHHLRSVCLCAIQASDTVQATTPAPTLPGATTPLTGTVVNSSPGSILPPDGNRSDMHDFLSIAISNQWDEAVPVHCRIPAPWQPDSGSRIYLLRNVFCTAGGTVTAFLGTKQIGSGPVTPGATGTTSTFSFPITVPTGTAPGSQVKAPQVLFCKHLALAAYSILWHTIANAQQHLIAFKSNLSVHTVPKHTTL